MNFFFHLNILCVQTSSRFFSFVQLFENRRYMYRIPLFENIIKITYDNKLPRAGLHHGL